MTWVQCHLTSRKREVRKTSAHILLASVAIKASLVSPSQTPAPQFPVTMGGTQVAPGRGGLGLHLGKCNANMFNQY